MARWQRVRCMLLHRYGELLLGAKRHALTNSMARWQRVRCMLLHPYGELLLGAKKCVHSSMARWQRVLHVAPVDIMSVVPQRNPNAAPTQDFFTMAHTHARTHARVHVHTHTHIHTHTHSHTRTHAHTHARMHTRTHTHTYTHTRTFAYPPPQTTATHTLRTWCALCTSGWAAPTSSSR